MFWLPGNARDGKLVGDILENPIISALVGSLVKSRDQKLNLPELRQQAEQLLRDAEVPSKLDEGAMRLHLNRLESEEIIEKVDGTYRLTARWADIAGALRVIPVKLTYRDYMAWPDDGRRYELFEGELYMVPSPSVKHQRISRKLMLLLAQFVDEYQLGEIFDAPLDVVFAEATFVQPDILFISHQRRGIIGEQNISGAPDLVVEILSPSTEERDRGIKSQLYCRYGVQEYWLVDPEERTVEVLALSPEGYEVLGWYSGDEVVSSQVLAGFQFPAEEIFD